MKFQYIFLTIFGIMAVVAVIIFAKAPSAADKQAIAARGNVTIWGTFPLSGGLDAVINQLNQQYKNAFSATYVFHDPETFDRDIVEALASGKGPDILLLPNDLILRHSDKIEIIPYVSIPERDFQALFIQAAEIYKRATGVLALPFAVDPMVMYWNRDLFNNESITQPPRYWDELLSLTPKLTKHDPKTSEITQSAVPFGEYVNVDNAKDILTMLFLQVGNAVVKVAPDGKPSMDLMTMGDPLIPNGDVASAFRFFMDFGNPLKNIYTWNRARGTSRNEFINGNLAMYFGFASDYKILKEKNPHLNFAVAPIPQPRDAKVEITFAHVHGLAVMKSSKNKQTAFFAVQHLLETEPSGNFAANFNLPPVRRDLLQNRPTDAVLSVFYDEAIRARTWLDPKPEESSKSFRQMVESVSSGRTTIPSALATLNTQLEALLQSYR